MKRLLLILALAACGDSTGPSPDITEGTLVGSYTLTKYNAANPPSGVTGSLNLRTDSSFAMAGTGGAPNLSGSWTLTKPGGNILLRPANCYGEIIDGGLGFGGCGYPLLYFRKR